VRVGFTGEAKSTAAELHFDHDLLYVSARCRNRRHVNIVRQKDGKTPLFDNHELPVARAGEEFKSLSASYGVCVFIRSIDAIPMRSRPAITN
jgi:hypothetical protein